jgi:hypothetical protein
LNAGLALSRKALYSLPCPAPALFWLQQFFRQSFMFLPWTLLRPWSFNLCFLHCWDHKHALLCQAFFCRDGVSCSLSSQASLKLRSCRSLPPVAGITSVIHHAPLL